MNKHALYSLPLLLVLLVIFSCETAKDRFELNQTVNDLSYTLSADKNPIPKGNVKLYLSIKDKSGKSVQPQFVDMRFYMSEGSVGTTIPGFRTPAEKQGDGYFVNCAFQREGEWNVDIMTRELGSNASMGILTFAFQVN